MTVHALLETIPPAASAQRPEPDSRQTDHAYDTVTVEAPTYEEARDQIMARVPDGWRVVHLRVER